MIPKPQTRCDRKVIAATKAMPCLLCTRQADPAHIRSRGAGGPDEPWNLIPLCRSHHMLQHAMGWYRFKEASYSIATWLEDNGWQWNGAKLWHPKLGPELAPRPVGRELAAGRDD